jgi:hypothetical protein
VGSHRPVGHVDQLADVETDVELGQTLGKQQDGGGDRLELGGRRRASIVVPHRCKWLALDDVVTEERQQQHVQIVPLEHGHQSEGVDTLEVPTTRRSESHRVSRDPRSVRGVGIWALLANPWVLALE